MVVGAAAISPFYRMPSRFVVPYLRGMRLNTSCWVPTVVLATATLVACSDDGNDDNGSFEVKTPTFQYTTTTWDDGWVSQVAEPSLCAAPVSPGAG